MCSASIDQMYLGIKKGLSKHSRKQCGMTNDSIKQLFACNSVHFLLNNPPLYPNRLKTVCNINTGLQNRRSLISKFKLLLDRTLSPQCKCRPSRRDFWKAVVVGPCPGLLLVKSQPLSTDGESMMIEYLALKVEIFPELLATLVCMEIEHIIYILSILISSVSRPRRTEYGVSPAHGNSRPGALMHVCLRELQL
jgi:hypothetical protein